MRLLSAGLAALLLTTGPSFFAQQKPEGTSLLGRPLVPPPIPAERAKQLQDDLTRAEVVYGRNPDDADATIWLGRRLAYLGRYREAIEHFSDGIEKHPDDARMYRHRGHRYITVRELDRAIADLAKAAALVKGRPDQVEPDGQPNEKNIPTSTLNTNIYYHLGLAHYLKGNFAAALDAYRECLAFSKNPDMQVATSHWLYMTLRRLNRTDEAARVLEPITAAMPIIENGSYHRLLLFYKSRGRSDTLPQIDGPAGLDAVTMGYGVGNWHFYNGQRDQAMAIFRRIVDEQPAQWAAFGYIAAEAELAR